MSTPHRGARPGAEAPAPELVPLAAPRQRVEWVDYAKGICIFFVVMLHVNEYVQESMKTTGWLEQFVTFARPFRMPDFFLIAGLFLASAMKRPWRHYLDKKVIHFLYFYVLWMTLELLLVQGRHALSSSDPEWSSLAITYLRRFIDPHGPLWFIHMLPIFFIVTRLTRKVPWWLMWLVAAALHSLQYKSSWNVPEEFCARYVYFYTGYRAAPYVFRMAAWAYDHAAGACAYLVWWAIANGVVVSAGWAGLPGVSLALGYAGALAVIMAAVLLSRQTWTGPLRYIGEHSIVVYLGDFVVTMTVVGLLLPHARDAGWLALGATIITVTGTIGLWQLLLRTPARFMYRRPAWLAIAR